MIIKDRHTRTRNKSEDLLVTEQVRVVGWLVGRMVNERDGKKGSVSGPQKFLDFFLFRKGYRRNYSQTIII